MSVNIYNKTNNELKLIAGGLLYADAPVGSIQAYGGTTAPSGWLLCQGQAVSRTTYAELFKAIGTAFGAGDGSTTFNVPDLREATTKGAGLSGKSYNHYDNAGLKIGQYIDDRLRYHDHNVYVRDTGHSHGTDSGSTLPNPNNLGITKNANGSGWAANPVPGAASNTQAVSASIQVNSNSSFSGIANRTSTAGNSVTNEVKAVCVNYIIKAKQASVPFDLAEYIRNQNVLSEWEEPIFDGDSFTAQYDGILNAWLSSDVMVNATMYINSVQIARLYPNAGIDSGIQLPIKKGDVLTFSLSSGAIANIYKKVAYYKLRDYTGR